jgi:NADH:ubiquinone oxidoreductase subunit 4 (subunit M)
MGELLILFGAFSTKLAFGLVASAGVALAAVYMIRMYQRSMHNRVGPDVAETRDLTRFELAPIAALVAVILALGVYPNFVAKRIHDTTFRSAGVAILNARLHQVGTVDAPLEPARGSRQ